LLLAACRRLRDRFGSSASIFREAVTDARDRRDRTVDLEAVFPAGAGTLAHEYVGLIEEIEGHARRGQLFVEVPGADVVRLRRWFADEVTDQFDGSAPVPFQI
jgi:hypothetical protein